MKLNHTTKAGRIALAAFSASGDILDLALIIYSPKHVCINRLSVSAALAGNCRPED